MSVKLIGYTKYEGSEKIDNLTDFIAFCARVSNPENQLNNNTSQKLIDYLMNHNHWSPFEMVNVCLEITTTRDIARQILRHRSFSFQEFSQRYARATEFTLREPRLQDQKNRQNSIPLDKCNVDHLALSKEWKNRQNIVLKICQENYQWALENGIAKEQARAILPEGCTLTKLYMNGSIRSWIHYISLRSANGTQKEHMDIARECGQILSSIFPQILKHMTHDITHDMKDNTP